MSRVDITTNNEINNNTIGTYDYLLISARRVRFIAILGYYCYLRILTMILELQNPVKKEYSENSRPPLYDLNCLATSVRLLFKFMIYFYALKEILIDCVINIRIGWACTQSWLLCHCVQDNVS